MTEDIQQLDMFANGSDSQAAEPQKAEKAPESVGSKPRANDLDGKTWTRYSISIWSDLRKTPEENQLKHPAMFPLALASRALECFTNTSDRVVLDPFVGVGTTVLAARNAGKYGIGIEISPEFAAIARTRLAQNLLFEEISGGDSVIHVDDARNLLKYVQPDIVDFCLTSPPYWDILLQPRTADYKEQRDYGDAEADLGKIGDYERFLQALMDIMRNVWVSLRPGKYCLMVVMDLRKKSRFYPFHADVADAMQEIGFLYDDLIIWDRRHEYNNMRPLGYPYTFRINKAHEYILIFQKPRTSPEP
jgi:DNA modification methylase